MLASKIAPRLRTSCAASSSLARPFTSTTATRSERAPALADIKPDQAAAFDARQKDFREQLIQNQRQREQQESQSSRHVSSASVKSSNASYSAELGSSTSHIFDEAMGSLTTHNNAEEARQREHEEASGANGGKGKKSGPLTSLIYGTAEGRQMDKDIEKSFSQVLARGKYVHSIVFHEVKPDKVDEYVELVGSWYPKVAGMPENKVHLVGSWRTEVGDCDTFGESTISTTLEVSSH